MPVRSGPISAPSPLCLWQLAHCSLNTAFPAFAFPVNNATGSISFSTFSRSRLGSAPPRFRIAVARVRILVFGWLLSVCFCSSVSSESSSWPFSINARSESVELGRCSKTATAAWRMVGVRPRILLASRGPTCFDWLNARASMIPTPTVGSICELTRFKSSLTVSSSPVRNKTTSRAAVILWSRLSSELSTCVSKSSETLAA